jgi:hypothetical protein
MTEAEYCETTNITWLLNTFSKEKSVQKWRMFAIACCRSVWPHLTAWAQESLVILESVACGEVPDFVRSERSKSSPTPESYADRAVWKAIRAGKEAREHANYYIPRHVLSSAGPRDGDPAREAVRKDLADAARDIFLNPFRPVAIDPAWRTADVLSLTQAAFDDRILPRGVLEGDRLSILSDALEEAGCTDAALLDHLRSPGPHVRGCWALDLILVKA